MLALKGTIDPSRDKNPEKPSFVVSSIQDVSKLVRAAAKKAAKDAGAVKDPEAAAAATSAAGTAATADDVTTFRDAGATSVVADAVRIAETASQYKEIHIRLAVLAAENEAVLYSLRACMEMNAGSCPVYIHVPASASGGEPCISGAAPSAPAGVPTGSGETIIRTAGQFNAGAPGSIGALSECAAVAEVWGA